MRPATAPLWWGVLLSVAGAASALADPVAFPGAEGFGAVSVGGRGGKVFHVTNLKRFGPGSLQAACEANGPRIVVFDVSGVIKGDVVIKASNITIAGQTAPGAGITIEGRLMSQFSNWDHPEDDPKRYRYHDIIIRHVRARPAKPAGDQGDCIQISDADRVILDHVSVSWGSDENIDLCASRDVTVQWSTIEESDLFRKATDTKPGTHNYGMIVGYEGKNITIHHNLFAHQALRTPLCGAEPMDHRNNVIYNCAGGICFHPARMNRQRPGELFQANVIGNYFKAGPTEPKIPGPKYVGTVIDGRFAQIFDGNNYFSWMPNGYVALASAPKGRGIYERTGLTPEEALADRPFQAPPVVTETAEQAYLSVLQEVGAFPRDVVTRRTIDEVLKGTGSWGRHDPNGGLLEGLTAGTAPVDTDGDGIPDAWELRHGLDPRNPQDRNKIVPAGASDGNRHMGYTYIEYYINEQADRLIAAPVSPGRPLNRPAACQRRSRVGFVRTPPLARARPPSRAYARRSSHCLGL